MLLENKTVKPQIPKFIHSESGFLKRLATTKSERKLRHLLKNATPNQLLAISEICLNIVVADFPLSNRQKRRLQPYANFVRCISRLKTEKGARKYIVQKGTGAGTGFFSALLAPILIELLQKLTKKDGQ